MRTKMGLKNTVSEVSPVKQGLKALVCAVSALALSLVLASSSYAASTACATVSVEIAQELTMERVAFDAKLVVTNNMPDKDLTNVNVDVYLNDLLGNVKTDIFFIKLTSMNNINAVDGTGTVKAGTAAEVHWLIIPSPGGIIL